MSDARRNGHSRANPGIDRKGAAALAAVALAGGASVAAAARLVGVNEKTVRRWNKNPKFRAKVHALRGEMTGSAVGLLTENMAGAATALVGLLKSRDAGTRLKASRAVLELAAKLRESEELSRRVDELERRQNAAGSVS